MMSTQQVDEEVFMRTSVPQSLYEVDHEAEAQRAERGEQEELFAQAIAGMTSGSRGSVETENEGESGDEEAEECTTFKKVALTEEERAQQQAQQKALRKANKKAVKEEKRERRKEKVPKQDRKRHKKLAQQKRKKH